MNKKLPYGISNFKNLIEDKYLYIDKTEYIEKIENFHSPYITFLRPRRFGKSLFTSVLANYYDINEKDNFEKLFGETYIGKNVTKEKNSYYILKFNFTGLNTDTKEDLEKTFIRTIKDSFNKFIEIYNLDVSYIQEGSAASIFENFLTQVSFKIKGQIYVIIDEYDHFANEILSFQTELFSSIVSKTGFVRKFYEVLKKGTEFIVKRIFMTGVSPITLDSLTSGFNISDDLTRNDSFNEMMGFTKKEVMDLIKNIVPKTLKKTELKELLETLQKNYNGYLFASDGKERLFNSDMILYYMKSYMNSGKGPESLIDKNIATDYGKLGKMFDLKNKSANMQVLEDVLKGERITARITEGFSLEKDFSKDDFKSLLFYLGMLTIDKKVLDRSTLKVPNYAIKGLYFEYFNKKLNETIDYEIDVSDIEDSITEIALEGKNENLIKVVEKTLNKLSNRDYIKFDEKYVKLIFLAYCFLSKIYLVKSEYEVESGYIDIALLKQANMEPTYFAIFQLKYITKAEYEKEGEKIIEEKKKEAIEQLQKYKASQELMGLPNLKKWALVFVNDSCVVNSEIE
ncbi:ATP-binding protein [Clostridium magnum]|uniref:Putative AAA-ATPase n=2 Tax=Clostridium magnum TaxID=33954 RepID=A0A161YF17_9CLOT|nr:ATP-binding protein [Clostridium magnum]KZL88612.1 putative AAA-ATPase [Clostridium magnum DSM 2767]